MSNENNRPNNIYATESHDSAPVASPNSDTPNRTSTALVVFAVVACLCSIASLSLSIYNYQQGATPITIAAGSDGNSASFTEGSIAEIANKVSPAVVSILTETRTTSFFGLSQTSEAAGTGMIVTADGYVLTNKHVVDGAKKISVVTDDGTTYENVELVGTDPLNDVAFLKIKDASNLPTVTLGNSKTLTAGQQVVAIGNALGQFQNTVTEGVISGTGRTITATADGYTAYENLTDMIQTDASINAGNSGGPLINAAGEVIGINTAVASDANGLGFAIPISAVKGMLKSIIATGEADRAYIGINYITLTPDVAQAYELNVTAGAYVYSQSGNPVIAGSPADKAGIKRGDIITAINGVKVGSAGTVSSLIGEYAPGDTVQLAIIRDGKEIAVNVTLAAYPSTTING